MLKQSKISKHAHRERIALCRVISLVLATQQTYIQSMLNLARFISFLLYNPWIVPENYLLKN